MNKFIQTYFTLFITVSMVLGFVFPDFFILFGKYTLQLLAGLMLSSFLGMDFKRFIRRIKKPGPYLLVFLFIKIVLAALLFFLIKPFDETIAVGVLLLVAAPSAGVSPTLTRICKGDVEFIIGFLIFTTIVSPFSLPITMNVLAGTEMDIDMMGMIETMVSLIIIPMTISVLAKRFLRKQVEKVQPYLSSTAVIILSLMLLGLTSLGAPMVKANMDIIPLYGGAALVLGIILSLSGYFFFGFMDRKKRIGLSLSTLYINVGLIVVLASRYFPERVMIFTLCYMIPANFFPWVIKKITAETKDLTGTPGRNNS
ncbi:MAG: hypothetical protein JEY99_14055 [Spirochaetales bacterium]|nr:hypothetical protein [Spirochaetales bacterium]